jgi:hypothetical protein
MELAWIDDFFALSSTLNFTKAASMWNVTQPTFSRRIRNLELSIGAILIDRSTFPITEEGRGFRQVAEGAAQSLYWERTSRAASAARRGPFYPHLMLCYSSAAGLLLLDGVQYPSVQVAEEYLLPVVSPDAHGRPRGGLAALSRGEAGSAHRGRNEPINAGRGSLRRPRPASGTAYRYHSGNARQRPFATGNPPGAGRACNSSNRPRSAVNEPITTATDRFR